MHFMFNNLTLQRLVVGVTISVTIFAPAFTSVAIAQEPGGRDPVHFKVEGPSQRLEMIANTSRILTLDKKIPKAQVSNPELLEVQPIAPNQIQIAALKPGVGRVNLWDEEGNVHTIDVIVTGDARELKMILESEFPNSTIKVRPLASSVVISGFVDRTEAVTRITTIAEDYYPKVINNLQVGGVQQVMLSVKVMEVSRTKLRALGVDWANFNGSSFIVQSASGVLSAAATSSAGPFSTADTLRFGIVNQNNAFFGLLKALQENQLTKLLAEPKLVTTSGRPATFTSGGEFPVIVPQSLGTFSIEYKRYGTTVNFVPLVLGNGSIRLEVRPMVSELDYANGMKYPSSDIIIPAVRERWADTAVEMKSGQTLALAGLLQRRQESVKRGVPWLADLPWAGAAFRKNEEKVNEIELLIMVTPELIGPMNPNETPPCGPGELTTSPSDVELYWRGYIEVPKCCNGNGCGQCMQGGMITGSGAYSTTSNGGIIDPYSGRMMQGQTMDNLPVINSARHRGIPSMRPVPAAVMHHQAARQPARVVPRYPDTRIPTQYSQANQGSARTSRRSQPAPVKNLSPKFIGPIGYDVLKY